MRQQQLLSLLGFPKVARFKRPGHAIRDLSNSRYRNRKKAQETQETHRQQLATAASSCLFIVAAWHLAFCPWPTEK